MPLLNDLQVDEYLLQSVKIDDRRLEGEMIQWSSELAYWNLQLARSLETHLRAKVQLSRVRARLKIQERARLQDEEAMRADAENENLTTAKQKPPRHISDPVVEAAVEHHGDLHAAEDQEVVARVEHKRIQGVADAVAAKGDMLRSLSRRILAEIGSDPSVRQEHRGDRMIQQQERQEQQSWSEEDEEAL